MFTDVAVDSDKSLNCIRKIFQKPVLMNHYLNSTNGQQTANNVLELNQN